MTQGETNDLREVIYHCRAMRRTKPDPVPEEDLIKLIDAANQGPSGGNAQPGRWIIVTDPGIKQQLADLNRTAIDKSYPAPEPGAKKTAFRWQYENMENIPALIIACAVKRNRPDTFQGGLATGGSVWPGIQNLLLTARAMGLGACPTTLPLQNKVAAKKVLNIPDDVEPIALITVGYPKGKFGPVTRRPLEKILHWNQWTSKEGSA